MRKWYVSLKSMISKRKLIGFIIAFAMISPYLTAATTVLAHDGTTEVKQSHEMSMEELELEYAIINEIIETEQRWVQELEQYLLISENGELELIIPNYANVNVTDEELGQIYVQLSFVNELVKNNLASIDRDDSGVFIGLKGNDDLFTIQANKNSFSVKWYGNRIRLSQSVMRRIDNAIDKAWDQFNSLTTTLLIAAAASIGKLITTGSVLNTLPTWLGVAILDITAALTAFFSNPYVIAITIVILVTAAYNIWQIDKAAKWSTGTEIRTYGAWGPAAISPLSLALPHYRKQ